MLFSQLVTKSCFHFLIIVESAICQVLLEWPKQM